MIKVRKLTQRENEVMTLIVDGYNNIEISEKLSISKHTTKAHVLNIYRKLGINNRVLAAKKYYEMELMEATKG